MRTSRHSRSGTGLLILAALQTFGLGVVGATAPSEYPPPEPVTVTSISVDHMVETMTGHVVETSAQKMVETLHVTETMPFTSISLATETVHAIETQAATQVVSSLATETVKVVETLLSHIFQTETVNNLQTQTVKELQTQTQVLHSVLTEVISSVATATVNNIQTVKDVSTQTVHSIATSVINNFVTEVKESIATVKEVQTQTQVIHSFATATQVVSSLATETVKAVETLLSHIFQTETVNNIQTQTVNSIQTRTVNNVQTEILKSVETQLIHQTIDRVITETINNIQTQTVHAIQTQTVASVATKTLLSHIIQTETRTQQIAGVPMLTSSPPPPAAVIHTSPLPVIIITETTTVPCDTTTPIGGAAAAATHTVTVGGTAGLVYTPPQVSAAVGDLVHFIFMSNNHSVTQSTFAAPCNRLATGMDSDLRPNPNNSVVPPPFWAFTVTTTEPTWWYCKQRVGNHCGQGMVFAINPTADKTFQMFKDTAIKINGTVSSSAAAATTLAATGTKTATALNTVPPSATAGGSGAGAATTHTVTVGGTAGLVYTPPQVSAAVGDLVHFIFMSNNHSVTQSTFIAPCNRLATGMDSDLRPNPNNSVVPPPFWAFTVTTTEPTWWYCKQRVGNHCGQGMVFAINPTADKTFQMFKDTAIKINGTVSSSTAVVTTPAAIGTKTATALTTTPPSVTAGSGGGGSGTAAATTHTVTVGGTAGLVYTPPQVSAAVGDLVHFIFMSNNHSVTQSTFAAPCNRLATGMDSDLRPNPNNSVVPPPFWAFTVTTTEPTWWYCKQRVGNHCGQGMVFAINPTADKTFQMFKDTAIKINGTVSSSTAAPAATGTKTATALTTVLPSATAGGSAGGAGNEGCKCQCFCPTAAYKASTQINARLQSTTMQTISTPSAVAVITNATILPSVIYSPSLSSSPLSSIPTVLSLNTTTKPASSSSSFPPSSTSKSTPSSTSKSTPAPTFTGTPTALAAETPKTTTPPPNPNPNGVGGYSSSLVLGLGGVKSTTSFSQMNVDFNTYSSLGGLKSVLNLSVAPTPTPRA